MIAKKEIDELKKKAKKFCLKKYNVEKTDGKSIGTLIEKEFKAFIGLISSGNTAKGIDLPEFETDIKVTLINLSHQTLTKMQNRKYLDLDIIYLFLFIN